MSQAVNNTQNNTNNDSLFTRLSLNMINKCVPPAQALKGFVLIGI